MRLNSSSVRFVFSSSASKTRLSYLVRMGIKHSLVSRKVQGSSLRKWKIFRLSTTSRVTQSTVYSIASKSILRSYISCKMRSRIRLREPISSSPGMSSTPKLTLLRSILAGVDCRLARSYDNPTDSETRIYKVNVERVMNDLAKKWGSHVKANLSTRKKASKYFSQGRDTIIQGDSNTVDGSNSTITGYRNSLTGSASQVVGSDNNVLGDRNLEFGDKSNITGSDNTEVGN
ncbi:unnamed protein product [Sphagnum balticum]